MSLNLTNLEYSEKDIGASLKISKRQFVWEFDLNGSSQRIELLDSRLSGKKRLYKNGVNLLNTIEKGNFIHNFEIDGHACVIIQYGDKIELRIDNQSFTHLYNLQKNKQMFAGEKGPTSNTYVAKPFNSYGNSEIESKQKTGEAIYKVNPSDENKPKLFNFEINKDTSNKPHAFNSKFKFGNKNQNSSSNSRQNNNNINNNNNNINNIDSNNNKGNIDLLGFQGQSSNENNKNMLGFNGINNSNTNNQNNQNQLKNGNDIFDLFGNNNNQSNNNQNSNKNNNNPFNNIFLALSDGTNQQNTFDQYNLGFMGINNNMTNNLNNNINNNNNMNINFNNIPSQSINQDMNQNNNVSQNQQNNGTIDLLNF